MSNTGFDINTASDRAEIDSLMRKFQAWDDLVESVSRSVSGEMAKVLESAKISSKNIENISGTYQTAFANVHKNMQGGAQKILELHREIQRSATQMYETMHLQGQKFTREQLQFLQDSGVKLLAKEKELARRYASEDNLVGTMLKYDKQGYNTMLKEQRQFTVEQLRELKSRGVVLLKEHEKTIIAAAEAESKARKLANIGFKVASLDANFDRRLGNVDADLRSGYTAKAEALRDHLRTVESLTVRGKEATQKAVEKYGQSAVKLAQQGAAADIQAAIDSTNAKKAQVAAAEQAAKRLADNVKASSNAVREQGAAELSESATRVRALEKLESERARALADSKAKAWGQYEAEQLKKSQISQQWAKAESARAAELAAADKRRLDGTTKAEISAYEGQLDRIDRLVKASQRASQVGDTLTAKDTAMKNRLANAESSLAAGQTTKAKSLIDQLKVVESVVNQGGDAELRAISKYGKLSVDMAKSHASQRIAAKVAEVDRLKALQPTAAQNLSAIQMSAPAVIRKYVAGPFSEYNASAVKTALDKLQPSLNTKPVSLLGSAFKSLSGDMNTTHSAARGLASGFGLLWLTWGQMLPLMAGAAVSFGLREVVNQGAEVYDTLTQLKTLAGFTGAEVATLADELLTLSSDSRFKPKELADSMQQLALAGLKAGEVSKALPEVMSFAVAGSTTAKLAAETLTTVGTAYGISADYYGHIADVIAKASAESRTSVEGMSEAFKTSSVINQQYGVSLEDTAVALAVLANAGVVNTSAGTALRNTYADLSGKSKEVSKIMQELGLDLTLVNGKFKDQGSVMSDLLTLMGQLSSKDAAKLMDKLTGERGSKLPVALEAELRKVINAYQEAGKGLLTYAEAYDVVKKRITDAAGFSIIAAAEQSLSAENQMLEVSSAFSGALVKAFESVQPYILRLSNTMQEFFNSAKFQNNLTGFVSMLGAIANGFMSVASFGVPAVTAVIAMYGAAKTAAIGMGLYATGVTAAGAAAVGTSRSVAVLTAVMLKNPIGLLTQLVLTAGFAWLSYKSAVDEAKNSHEGFTGVSLKALGEKLEKEANRLRAVNDERRTGISLIEQEARTVALLGNTEEHKVARDAESAYQKARQDRVLAAAEAESGAFDPMTGVSLSSKLPELLKAEESARWRAVESRRLIGVAQAKVDYQIQQNQMAALERDRAMRKQMEANATPARLTGMQLPETLAGSAGGRGDYSSNNYGRTGENDQLSAMKKLADIYLKDQKSNYDFELKILENSHSGKLVSEAEYQVRLGDLVSSYETQRAAYLRNSLTQYVAERDAAEKELDRVKAQSFANFKGTEEQKQAFSKNINTNYINDKQQLNDKYVAIVTETANAIEEADRESLLRRTLAQQNNAARSKAIELDLQKFWAEDAAKLGKEAALASLTGSEAEKAAAAARYEAAERYGNKLAEVSTQLEAQVTLYKAYQSLNGPLTAEQQAAFAAAEAEVAKVQKILKDGQAKAAVSIAQAGSTAYDRIIQQDVDKLKTATADAIETALFEGGDAGKKKLRDMIVGELRKPVRMFIDAVINPIMGSLIGGLGFGGAAMAGQAGGSAAGSAAASAMGSLGLSSLLSSVTSIGSSIGSGALSTISGWISGGAPVSAAGAGSAAFKAGTATPYVGAALLALNALGVFRRTKTVGGGLIGTLGDGDIQSYDLKRKSGTLFSGPDYSIGNLQKSAFSDMIQADWKRASSTVVDFAKTIGLATSAADGFTAILGTDKVHSDSSVIGINLDDLRGKNLTDEQYVAEVKKRIGEALVAGSEQLAQRLIGSWRDGKYVVSEYARANETALETLGRLSGSLSKANSAFELLGFRLYATSLAGADAASSFADLLGGADSMSSTLAAYYTSFYSEAERVEAARSQLKGLLAKQGVELPGSNDEYRKLVSDAMAAGDTKLAAELLKLSSAYAQLTESTKTLAETSKKAADDMEAAADSVREAISSLIQPIIDAVTGARDQLAGSVKSIIGSHRSLAEIKGEVAKATVSLPSSTALQSATSAVTAAYADKALKDTALTGYKAVADSAYVSLQTAQTAANSAASALEVTKSNIVSAESAENAAFSRLGFAYGGGFTVDASGKPVWSHAETNGQSRWATNGWQQQDALAAMRGGTGAEWGAFLREGGARPTYDPNAPWNKLDALSKQFSSDAAALTAANSKLISAAYSNAIADAQYRAATLAKNASATAVDTALAAQVKAQDAYAAALRNYAGDAGKAITKLNALREETVALYEAQKELADGMLASAKSLKEAAANMRYGQIDAGSSLAYQAKEFDRVYNLANKSTGADKIKYADEVTAKLPALGEAYRSQASSRSDWIIATSKLFAQASILAAGLESAVPKDYQAESLATLGAIDANLKAIGDATQSAEKIISDAIFTTGGQTLNGLRAVVAQLQGKAVPAFATGGVFTNGIVTRPTMFNMGLMGEKTEEAIMPLRRTADGSLGVMASSGGSAEVVAELRALRSEVGSLKAEVSGLRAEAKATAISTGRLEAMTKRVTRNGEAMQTEVAT